MGDDECKIHLDAMREVYMLVALNLKMSCDRYPPPMGNPCNDELKIEVINNFLLKQLNIEQKKFEHQAGLKPASLGVQLSAFTFRPPALLHGIGHNKSSWISKSAGGLKVKALGQTPRDPGLSPAWHSHFSCSIFNCFK